MPTILNWIYEVFFAMAGCGVGGGGFHCIYHGC